MRGLRLRHTTPQLYPLLVQLPQRRLQLVLTRVAAAMPLQLCNPRFLALSTLFRDARHKFPIRLKRLLQLSSQHVLTVASNGPFLLHQLSELAPVLLKGVCRTLAQLRIVQSLLLQDSGAPLKARQRKRSVREGCRIGR